MIDRIKKKNAGLPLVFALLAATGGIAHADGWTIGDEQSNLHIGGALRARYDYDFSSTPTTSKVSLDTAILNLTYKSPTVIGNLQWRCYEYYGHVCDANFPVDAWVGYKFGDKHQVQVGLNPISFGLGQYWGNTFYLGLGNVLGLEDAHDLGVKYSYANGPVDAQVAFYPRDGGNYTGQSRDSKRFTVNLVNADPYVPNGTQTSERNMLIGRVAYKFKHSDTASTEVGVSGWTSEVHNNANGENGSRKALAIHTKNSWNNWNLQLLAANQKIDTKNPGNGNLVSMGGFDGSFNVAAKGNVYVADLSYNVDGKFGDVSSIKPYLNYSTFRKSESGFNPSTRIIPGVSFNYQKLSIYAEMHYGKHDQYVGEANGLGAGTGPDGWVRRFYLNAAYYF